MRMHRFLKFVVIAIVALILPLSQLSYSQTSQPPNPTQRITFYSKPAVVRVVAGCTGGYIYEDKKDKENSRLYYDYYSYGGQGSGFFISPDGYIATRGISKDESTCKDRLFKRFTEDLTNEGVDVDTANLKKENVKNFKFFHSVVLPKKTSPSVPFEVKVASAPLTEGKDVSIIKIAIENAPALKLADSAQVLIQDEVTAIGYPSNADLPELDKPKDKDEAAVEDFFKNFDETQLRSGDTSSFEASVTEGRVSNPNKKLGDNYPVLQIDMQAGGYGSAGSPILNAQGEVIGMLASDELDKNIFGVFTESDVEKFARLKDGENTIPIAIPAATIHEFIQDSGATNEQAPLDEYYRSGLDLYWQGDFAGAKVKFEAVKALFPQHSEVERLIRECNKNLVDDWYKPKTILWGAIAAVAALLLGLIFFLVRRKPSAAPRPSTDVRPFARHSPTGAAKSNNSKAQTWLELEGVGETRKLPLYKDTHRIGRDPAWSDIEMPASWEVLSRHHALFKREGDSYRVFDGDGKVPSRNGLLIDDYDKVDSIVGHLLRPGDTLAIGSNPREQVRITYFNSAAGQAKDETKAAT